MAGPRATTTGGARSRRDAAPRVGASSASDDNHATGGAIPRARPRTRAAAARYSAHYGPSPRPDRDRSQRRPRRRRPCARIYAPYVRDTNATFELEPPGADAMGERIAAARASHAWLVAEREGEVLGYAYGVPFAERPAYRWSAEVSVYLAPGARGIGVGSALYAALLDRLRARGMQVALARVAQPNAASEALHARFGFERSGLLRRIGYKNGRWHDVALLQLDLIPAGEADPAEPR